MAPHEYLFVNKDLSSPSLSRNTGCEASLASQVNKHVQQQRFWQKDFGQRTRRERIGIDHFEEIIVPDQHHHPDQVHLMTINSST